LMRINVSLAYTEYTIEGSSILRTRSQPGGLSTAKERETIGVGVGSSQSIF